MSREAPLLIEREDLLKLCFLLTHMVDGIDLPNEFLKPMFDRHDAEYWLGMVSEMLAFDGPGVRHLRLVPATFHVQGYHTTWVDQFVAEMPKDLRARVPAQIAIARHSAELVDCDEYSTDFRLDARSALEAVMASLQRLEEDDEAEAELRESL